MVRRVRTPSFAKGVFSGDELYGWETGVAIYSPTPLKEKPRKKRKHTAIIIEEQPAPPAYVVVVHHPL